MAEVSVSKAARMTGKGRSTIQRHMKEGKLSAGKDAAGNPVIDTSELLRVYGALQADEADRTEPVKQSDAPEADQSALAMIEVLRDELRAAREREDWLKGQLEASQERSRELERRMLPPGEPETAPGPGEEKKGFFRRLFGG